MFEKVCTLAGKRAILVEIATPKFNLTEILNEGLFWW